MLSCLTTKISSSEEQGGYRALEVKIWAGIIQLITELSRRTRTRNMTDLAAAN